LGRAAQDPARDIVEELGKGFEHTSTQDQHLRVEQRDEVREGDGEVTRGVAPQRARQLIAGVGRGRDHRGLEGGRIVVGHLAQRGLQPDGTRVAEAALEAGSGGVLLETAAAAAGARQPVRHDLRVTELAGSIASTGP
jgi:hypothetical protein